MLNFTDCFAIISAAIPAKWCVLLFLQLSTGSEGDGGATNRLGLIIGLSVGVFVAIVFVVGELFMAM